MPDPSFPAWTAFRGNLDNHQGLYPLGLEAVGAGMVARQLLPAIPGSVVHARYFSFLCWCFWTYRQHLIGKGAQQIEGEKQLEWLYRLEHVLRAATLSVNAQTSGIIGRRSAIIISGLSDSDSIPVSGKYRAPSAFVPAAYSASFAMLGCGGDKQGLVWLTKFGESLAEAYDQTIRAVPGGDAALHAILSSSLTVSVGAIRAIQYAFALRPVEPDEAEHPMLVDLLFRFHAVRQDVPGSLDSARSRCLALLLDIVGSSHGGLKTADDLHHVFATGLLPDGTTYLPPSPVAHTLGIWQRYEERQGEKLGLHGFWHAITQYLLQPSIGSATNEAIVAHMVDIIAGSSLAADWLGGPPDKLTVRDAEQRVLTKATAGGRPPGSTEVELIEQVMRANNPPEDLAAALILLLLSTAWWRSVSADIPASLTRLHERGGRERIALGTLTRDAEVRSAQTIAEYLGWLVEYCVLSQSTSVALEKLARGDYRFFIVREEGGFSVVRRQNPGGYLARDASRLNAALALLADLRLVDSRGGVHLTQEGRTTLRDAIAFHTERLVGG